MKTKTSFGHDLSAADLEATSGGLALSLLPVVMTQNQNFAPSHGLAGWRGGVAEAPEPDYTPLYVNAALQVFRGVMSYAGQGEDQHRYASDGGYGRAPAYEGYGREPAYGGYGDYGGYGSDYGGGYGGYGGGYDDGGYDDGYGGFGGI